MQTQPFADLVDESLDEAQFLWRRWESELTSLTRNLDEIVNWTEDRLQGALDGVRVAPDALLESTLTSALASDDLARVTIAAHLLATAKTPNARSLLSDAIRLATGEKLTSCIRGLEVAQLDGSFAPVTSALLTTSAEHRAALCRLKAFRRATLGQELVDTFESGVPVLQAQALQAAAYLSSERVDAWIKTGLESPEPSVRQAAMLTGIRRRNRGAWEAAVQLTRMAHLESAPVLSLVGMFGGVTERQAVLTAASEAPLRKSALQALGNVGTRDAVELCLQAMTDDGVAGLAGESYCAITGANLERDKLTKAAQPEAEPPTFEQDDLNADLVPSDEQSWPKPDADAVRRHWDGIQSQYVQDARYVYGRVVDIGNLIAAIETGPMLRRPQFIIEVAVRSQGAYDVEPREFSQQQRRMMATARTRAAS